MTYNDNRGAHGRALGSSFMEFAFAESPVGPRPGCIPRVIKNMGQWDQSFYNIYIYIIYIYTYIYIYIYNIRMYIYIYI